jgi:transcriptional regulator with XRE-family HTH domain
MELANWVKAARTHAGWTIEKLAEEMGRSKAAAGFWERGTTRPSYEQVTRIAKLTGWPMPDETAPTTLSDIQNARGNRWPFPRVDQQKLLRLRGPNARNLENAILAAAADLSVDLRTVAAGKSKRA